jgi:hypothetical protein
MDEAGAFRSIFGHVKKRPLFSLIEDMPVQREPKDRLLR